MLNIKFKVDKPNELEVTIGKGVKGTLCIPHSSDKENPFNEGFAPATVKVALILHGQAGHRNYCYQKHLAHILAAKYGIYSLRIDFRGCGDSSDNENPEVGRVLEQDVEDIQACAEFLIDGKKNPLRINFTLSSIIGHSRGGVAMFLWALKQNELLKSCNLLKPIVVPNLVNCSSRFTSHAVYDKYPANAESFDKIPQFCYRHGKYQYVDIMKQELISLATADLSNLRELSTNFSVLSIYGLEDNIIPINDSSLFANILNRGLYSHRLELIAFADHNFYGTVEIDETTDVEIHNSLKLPITSKNLVNYNYVVIDLIMDFLKPENESERFLHRSHSIGRVSRWKNIEGVSNFRDLGGYQIYSQTFHNESNNLMFVKPNYAFRCANMSHITENGLKGLQSLNIKTIFDLRSDGECERDGTLKNVENYGIKRIHVPIFKEDDYSPQELALRYKNLMTSWFTYVHVYENILQSSTESFRTIFEYIKNENKPFVFHCTAGKDRTGILSMLILLLLGLDKDTISREYELTTVGLKPEIDQLKSKFLANIGVLRENKNNFESLEKSIGQGRKNWTIENDGFQNLMSSRYEAMLVTIELFNKKYNGIINYMKDILKFKDQEIRQIYYNLIVIDKQDGFEISSLVNWEHLIKAKI